MATAYLGIGSNMGDRQKNIDQAVALLLKNDIRIIKQSSIIETEPHGGPVQGKFLNGVCKIETRLSPLDLLNILKKIETSLGRIKTVSDGPRPIDLDILLYNNLKFSNDELTIPHPRMLKRDFVLIPLNEIEPLWVNLLPL